MRPWAVIVSLFCAIEQIARTELLRCAENSPPIGMSAAFHLEEVMGADIDAMITDEDRKRLLGVKLEELLKEEELAGIIVKERS